MTGRKKINLDAPAHEEDEYGDLIPGYEEVSRDQIFWFARMEAGLNEASAEAFADWADQDWEQYGNGDPELTNRDQLETLLYEWRGGEMKKIQDWQKHS